MVFVPALTSFAVSELLGGGKVLLIGNVIEESFMQGMQHFGNIIPDFDRKDAIMSGIESRTSSPIRINRDDNFESNIKGIYPIGEGAGYAGGIVSSALDGINCAAKI